LKHEIYLEDAHKAVNDIKRAREEAFKNPLYRQQIRSHDTELDDDEDDDLVEMENRNSLSGAVAIKLGGLKKGKKESKVSRFGSGSGDGFDKENIHKLPTINTRPNIMDQMFGPSFDYRYEPPPPPKEIFRPKLYTPPQVTAPLGRKMEGFGPGGHVHVMEDDTERSIKKMSKLGQAVGSTPHNPVILGRRKKSPEDWGSLQKNGPRFIKQLKSPSGLPPSSFRSPPTYDIPNASTSISTARTTPRKTNILSGPLDKSGPKSESESQSSHQSPCDEEKRIDKMR
jgi:hypothetical protein